MEVDATMLIETQIIRTRRAELSDAEFVAKVLTNEDVQKYTGGVKASYEQTIDHIRSKPETLRPFYIIETTSGDQVGYVALFPNNDLGTEEPLISLLPQHWRKGYGNELLRYVKEHWMANNGEMLVTVHPDNTASLSLLKRQGFSFVKNINNEFGQKQHVYRAKR